MKYLLLVLFLSGCYSAANAQNHPYDRPNVPTCIQQDWLHIEDDGPEKAILIYSNSIESCSVPGTSTYTAPNGISVRVTIIVDDAETIIIEPVDPNFMAFPPEADVKDGNKIEIIIMGGLS